MSRDRFEASVKILFDVEGYHGYDSAGGDTWYGIAHKFHPDEPWPPTKERAVEIYRDQYWNRYHCGELPWPLDCCLFDGVVNQDATEVIRELQRVLRVEPDGIMGVKTIDAAEKVNINNAVVLFMARRGLRYAYRSEEKYRVGLMARLFRVQRAVILVNSLVG